MRLTTAKNALRSALLIGLLVAQTVPLRAAQAPFDLAGPNLEVRVTRAGVTLPITQVPTLAEGDRLWIKAGLPESQSQHYLLVLSFLRGSTNPPPREWFYRCETWGKCGHEGFTVTVPKGAQQVLVFFAPETGGDFKTLVSAARGRPGSFVRASQDLNQAALDRSRLEAYLASIRRLNASDPARLRDASALLARSLAIRVNDKCLEKIPELQAPCLMDGQEALILNDGHSTSIVEALTAGPASDLAMEASFTPQLSYGYYSPYIASILDIGRIFSSFTSAKYQYIPALTTFRGDDFSLILNTPPSFNNPKSVLVTALPAVEQPQLPPLHAVNPSETYCARKTSLVLPVDGAPLVFSAGYAHDVTLSFSAADGKTIQLPAKADAEQGGFVVDTSALADAHLTDSVKATLSGYWGFEHFEGPGFQLANSRTQTWTLADPGAASLIVGREATVHLKAASISCVDHLMLRDPAGKELKAEWKAVRPNEVEVTLPLQQATPGALTLLVDQFGDAVPDQVPLQAFAETGHLSAFEVHAGDSTAVLRGNRLSDVASLTIQGVQFTPGQIVTGSTGDELTLTAGDPATASQLKQTDAALAKVSLKDGRTVDVKASVGPPRPSAKLLSKNVNLPASARGSKIHLANDSDVPQDGRLRFSVRTEMPATFARDEQIDVATEDEIYNVTLTLTNGGLTLEDAKVVVASLDPAKALGASAFGPLKFRVSLKGVPGDWQPLATIVRLPDLQTLKCPASPDLACKLTGSNLFLIDAVSGNASFDQPAEIPPGFAGDSLPAPHPTDGKLYVRLRDNPQMINIAELNPEELPPSPKDALRAEARKETEQVDAQAQAATAEAQTAQPPNGQPVKQ